MKKTCSELFEGLECSIIGNPYESVEGLAYRSDKVVAGDVFFCIVGFTVDGHSFAQDAIDRGAKVIVVERKLYLADATDVTEVVVSDSRKAMAHAAANFYDHPSKSFELVGITGTNGKTTTSYLVEQIAHAAGKRTGVVGTVGIEVAGAHHKVKHTTPEAPDLQKTFAQMRDAHCEVVAIEVSSHALDLMRTWQTTFAVTAFLNLTQDHLDYHRTFEAYFEAKALLFSKDYPAKRVICIDDKWGKELLRRCSAAGDVVITTGFDTSAQVRPLKVVYASTHTSITLEARGHQVSFDYPLVGRFNVENALCAFGVGLALGFSPDDIAQALAHAPQVAGRLERVVANHNGGLSVFVDYAHTPDALQNALDTIIDITNGRTIVVFGCGGERDHAKRSIMGRVSLAADFAVVTSDNPRHEDPHAIIEDIISGMGEPLDHYAVEPDRRLAIALAIQHARAGDSILIAGKGHENYQLVGDEVRSFDDRVVAAEELERAFGAAGEEKDKIAAPDAPGAPASRTSRTSPAEEGTDPHPCV